MRANLLETYSTLRKDGAFIAPSDQEIYFTYDPEAQFPFRLARKVIEGDSISASERLRCAHTVRRPTQGSRR